MRLKEFVDTKGWLSKILGNSEPQYIKSLTIPSGTRGPEVADIQKVLKAAGSKYGTLLGPYGDGGVDGIIGPYTKRAIAAFQKDNTIEPSGVVDNETISKLNKVLIKHPTIPKSTTRDVVSGQSEIKNLTPIDSAAFADNYAKAKQMAEAYRGQPLSPVEWDWLVRATIAEASPNPDEQANVMGVILNRARNANSDIISILRAKNQFQAVTGTPRNRTPSSAFANPGKERINALINNILLAFPQVAREDKGYVNFTASDPSAYGPGTDLGWLRRGKATGVQIGKTWFFR